MKIYRRKKKVIMLAIVFVMIMIFCISIFNGKIQTLNSNGDVEKKKNAEYSMGSGTYDDPWVLAEKSASYDLGIRAYITGGGTLKISRAFSGRDAVMPDFPIWTGSDYKDKIKNVEIYADEVTNISDHAFAYLTNLENITFIIEDGNTSILKTIEDSAFRGCTSLTDISIPSTVTEIGTYAFHCTGLENIIIPDSVATIGEYAFSYCASLQNITIPDSVTTIGENAFYGCASNLTISCSRNSCAMIYALQNNIAYSLIGNTEDNTAPTITTKYSTTSPTDGTVVVELTSNEPIKEFGDWTLLDDKLTIRKEYSENVKEEKVYVADLLGNQTEVTITIDNIYYTITLDQQGGTGGIDNLYVFKNDGIYKDIERTQKIEKNSDGTVNIGTLPTKEGYQFIGYKDSRSSEILITRDGYFTDGLYDSLKAGNKEISDNTLYAQWQDTTPPQVTVSYSTKEQTYDSVIVLISSNEVLQKVDGWTLINNGESMKKEYTENVNEEITVLDEAGNPTSVRIVVENIKNKEYKIVLNKNGGTGGTDYLYVVCKDAIYKDAAHTQKLDVTNSRITISELPTKEGLSFNGYSTEQNGGNIEIDADGQTGLGTYQYMIYTYNSTEDYNLYAQWLDTTPPQVSVSYSTTEETYDSVTATIISNEVLQSVEGWTLIGNCKTMEKKYTKNTDEEVTVSDEAGNTAKVNIKIENIKNKEYKIVLNKNGGTGGTDYLYVISKDGIYKDAAHTQKLDETNGRVIISELPTKEGVSFNGYSTEQNGGNMEIDANGQTGLGTYQYMIYTYNSTEDYNLYAQWIDNIAPKATVTYSTTEQTEGSVTVTITSNEQIQKVEGWTLSSDGLKLTRTYSENKTETVKIIDISGNETTVDVKISNIVKEDDDIDPNGDINKDGAIDVTDLLILKRHIIAGDKTQWIIPDEKIELGDLNGDEKIDITDLLLMKRIIIAKEEN